MGYWSIFNLFIWKNYKSLKFTWKSTSFVLLSLIALLIIYLKTSYHAILSNEIVYTTQSEDDLKTFFSGEDNDIICYTPNVEYLDELMEGVRIDLGIVSSRVHSFSNEDDMFVFMDQKKSSRSFAISFSDYPGKNFSEQKDLNYTISATHNKVSTRIFYLNDKQMVGIREYDDYIYSGFFTLQHNIDKNYMKLTSKTPSIEIEVSAFPRREMEDFDSTRILFFGMLFVVFINMLLLSTMLVPLVEEKQDGIKEFLALATTYSFMDEVSFFIVRFLVGFIFVGASLLFGCIYQSIGDIPFVYVFLLFLLLLLSLMAYTFLISVLFNSVFYAKVGGFVAYYVPIVLFAIEGSFLEKFSFISSNNVFFDGIKIFEKFAIKKRDFGSESLFINITDDSYKLITVYLILIGQYIIYIFLYFYISNIIPGKGGVRKPFYFIFQPSFYFKRKEQNLLYTNESPDHEEAAAVKIRNLSKNFRIGYGRQKVAVDNLNMDIKNNCITTLLGHNGAGKTTTINMIIGTIARTAGDIIVGGYNNPSSYRHLIGFCPQHTIFMQYMTCAEHLQFFARLRGFNSTRADQSTTILLDQLNLKDKAQEVGRNLSGGMKRRLSLGMAIIGNTKIIILDEPSSGLDPESRRELWNILLELRKNNAILVTTHYMEEAEVLGDIISIMSNGKLVCSGSSLQLKREYGSGYVLKLLVKERFDINATISVIHKYIPTAKVKTFVDPTLCISLPYSYQSKYSELLLKLEELAHNLNILGISITNTSLEDVFLNCTTTDDEPDSVIQRFFDDNVGYEPVKDVLQTDPTKHPKIIAKQSFAILYKKCIYIKREWLYCFFMFLIPFVSFAIAFRAMSVGIFVAEEPRALPLNINHLNGSEIYFKPSANFELLGNYIIENIRQDNAIPIIVPEDQTVESVLLQLQYNNITHFYEKVFGAVEIHNGDNGWVIKILYSGNAIHSSASMLNLVDNALLQVGSGADDINIETANMPIRRPLSISPSRLEYYSSIIPVGWFFYMLFYVSLPFKEEKSEFKFLQNTSVNYWITFSLVDLALHISICILTILPQKIVDSKQIYDDTELAWFVTTFMFYGLAYLPILYIMASSFRSLSALSSTIFLLFTISTISPIITSGNLESIKKYEAVIAVMNFLPDFALKHQLRLINENYFIRRRMDLMKFSKGEHISHTDFREKHEELFNTTTYYFYMIAVHIIFELLLIFVWENTDRRQAVLDTLNIRTLFTRGKKLQPTLTEIDDVLIEKKNVDDILKENEEKNYPLIVRNLQKQYPGLHAVRGISFTVKPGECFGLLGLNGAGKSTTFQMITANLRITQGDVYINGVNSRKNRKLYKFSHGYCPQAYALNDFMTSYEILKYMALLRGLNYSDIDLEVMKWITLLDLTKYKDIPIKQYSGGTKRKLSTAISMIGEPPVIFLDEPTTGVDPKSRRFMWNSIQKFQSEKKTIVLTSHSMDECEYLCNRLAIMARGQFQCIGFIPQFKANLGYGYTITLKIKEESSEEDRERLKLNISDLFRCALREQHAGVLTYFVFEKPIKWSSVFDRTQILLTQHQNVLEDYSVSEITLEDIFLKFESKSDIEETSPV